MKFQRRKNYRRKKGKLEKVWLAPCSCFAGGTAATPQGGSSARPHRSDGDRQVEGCRGRAREPQAPLRWQGVRSEVGEGEAKPTVDQGELRDDGSGSLQREDNGTRQGLTRGGRPPEPHREEAPWRGLGNQGGVGSSESEG